VTLHFRRRTVPATSFITGVPVSIREAYRRGRSRATFPILTVPSIRSRLRRGIFGKSDARPREPGKTAHALHATHHVARIAPTVEADRGVDMKALGVALTRDEELTLLRSAYGLKVEG
jgi:hypothetical protein